VISFFVPGKPQAQGSKVKGQWGNMRETNKELGPWRERVAMMAHQESPPGLNYLPGVAVTAAMEFVLYRPVSAPKSKTVNPCKKPDLDKMVRAILDALTNVLWADDTQVTAVWARKRVADLGESPGVHVWVGVDENTGPTH
jgi:crossover junction endodeoxyribonuclease RusA